MSLYQKSPNMFKPLFKPLAWCGRAARREFWMFQITAVVLWLFWEYLWANTENGVLVFAEALAGLYLLSCEVGVVVRRLHDADRSGWWALPLLVFLLPGSPVLPEVLVVQALVLLAFVVPMAWKGTPGENRFGADPQTGVEVEDKFQSRMLGRALPVLTHAAAIYLALGGVALHLYSVFLAVTERGVAAAFATFLLPLLSEAYWFLQVVDAHGIGHFYSLGLIVYAVAFVFFFSCSYATSRR